MARTKSNGPYAPLSATYYRDDAILEVGEEAELLFVRCLAFLADAASDGFITERQMKIVVAMGLERVADRIDALLSVGLIERIDGGFIVRSWLKWNKSTDEIGKHLKRDRERKAKGTQKDSAPIPDGIQPDSAPQITTNQVNTNQVNTQTPPAPTARELETIFLSAYESWPKKVERKQAFEKFKKACKIQSPENLATEITRFGDAYSASTERQFVPSLAAWIHGERWTDELPRAKERSMDLPVTAAQRNLSTVAYFEAQEQNSQMGIES